MCNGAEIRKWGCYATHPRAHPFFPALITNVACGYETRKSDPRCAGCAKLTVVESVTEQLARVSSKPLELGPGGKGEIN